MGILDIIGEDLERLDEILNGSRGWFLQLGEDVTRVSFEFSFGEHYIVEYFPGLENPWAFYIDGMCYEISGNDIVEKIKEIL
jgi:hypothetical protein